MISEKAILVKQGKPISFHRGVEPICKHCKRVETYFTYECKHPKNSGENYNRYEYKQPCTELEWQVCPFNLTEKLELCLPCYGRSTELLREFVKNEFHGELVVTLNSQREIKLTIYSIEPEENGNLKSVSYKIV